MVQPGTMSTDMMEREQKFELPEYAHWSSSLPNDSHGTVSGEPLRRAGRQVADLVDRRSLPPRVPVGLRSERLFARAVPGPAGQARPVAVQVVPPAPLTPRTATPEDHELLLPY